MSTQEERQQAMQEKAQQLAALFAVTDANGHPTGNDTTGHVALKSLHHAHMLDRAKRTGASPERIAQLEALNPNPATNATGNVAIDPITMQPKQEN